MLSDGVVRESRSAWQNPIIMLHKKGGTMWSCTGFRKVNSRAYFDAYPVPQVEDLIERIGGAWFIFIIDMAKGYW